MPAKTKPSPEPATSTIAAVPAAPLPLPTTLGDAHRIPRQLIGPYSALIECSLAAPADPDKAATALGALDDVLESEGGTEWLTSQGIDPKELGDRLLALIPAED